MRLFKCTLRFRVARVWHSNSLLTSWQLQRARVFGFAEIIGTTIDSKPCENRLDASSASRSTRPLVSAALQ